jgi:hypothetical protein
MTTEEQQADIKLAEAVEALQKHGKDLTVSQLWRVLLCLRLGVIIGTVAGLVSLSGAAFTAGVFLRPSSSGPSPVVERNAVAGLLDFNGDFAHTDLSTWMVPLVRYLESPGYSVVKLQTKPFPTATESFHLELEPLAGSVRAGLVFRISPAAPAPLLQPIGLDQTGSNIRVAIPRCEKGESLLLLLRVSGNQPGQAVEPSRVINLRVTK